MACIRPIDIRQGHHGVEIETTCGRDGIAWVADHPGPPDRSVDPFAVVSDMMRIIDLMVEW